MRISKSFTSTGIQLFAVVALLFSTLAYSGENKESPDYKMRNSANPATNLITGGQPTLADLKKMAKDGVKVIVNLRTKGEFRKFNEKKAVESLGMKYVSIPIGDEKDFSLKNAISLDKALNDLKEPAVVHCASSNRVGGLLALREILIKKASPKEAISFGRKAGMKSTEKTLRKVIKEKR